MPDSALTRAQLYSQADAALYAAKHAGRTDVIVFDASEVAIEAGAGSSAAVAAVTSRGQLRAVYQPIGALCSLHQLRVEGPIRPVSPAPVAAPPALFGAARAR